MDNQPIKDIVIVGTSSLAWLSAVSLAIALKRQVNITMVNVIPELESEIFYAGGHFVDFHRNLGINLNHLIQQGNALTQTAERHINFFSDNDVFIGNDLSLPTFRSIEAHQINAWLKNKNLNDFSFAVAAAKQNKFVLPTGKTNHVTNSFEVSLQIKTNAYIQFMAGAAKQLGVQYISQKIQTTDINAKTGFIESMTLADNKKIAVDFIIDTTATGEVYQKQYQQDFQPLKPERCFNAMIERKIVNNEKLVPYSTKIATKYGLIEKAVFKADTVLRYFYPASVDKDLILNDFNLHFPATTTTDKSTEFNVKLGAVSKLFYKNSLRLGEGAIGLGYSFIPMANFSVRVLSKLLDYFPNQKCLAENTVFLNKQTTNDLEEIKLFNELYFYYQELNEVKSKGISLGKFILNNNQLSDQARLKIQLFLNAGRVSHQLNPIIPRQKWINLLVALFPEYQYEALLDVISKEAAIAFLEQSKTSMKKLLVT